MCIIELRKHFTLKIIGRLKKKLTLVGLEPRAFAPRPTIPPPAATEAEQWSSFNCINEKEFLNKPLDGAGCTQEVPGLCMLGNKILHG